MDTIPQMFSIFFYKWEDSLSAMIIYNLDALFLIKFEANHLLHCKVHLSLILKSPRQDEFISILHEEIIFFLW